MTKKIKIRILIAVVCALLSVPLVILPVASVSIYEAVFGRRYETPQAQAFSVEDFEGLQVTNYEISTDYDVTLAGYGYEKPSQEIKGVVVLAHGLGGGGHNGYMPFIDVFTENGYCVFAYDATGNDNSTGRSVVGLPQGIKDLDTVLSYLKNTKDYAELPILLFGHSWGAYSAGCVLNLHPDVEAAVLLAGFNESEDLLLYQAKNVAGVLAEATIQYVFLYEKIKFGETYADLTAVQGIEKSDAEVLVVHSKDDTTVPAQYGYNIFHEAFSDSDRVDFLLYEDRGHNYPFYKDEAFMEQVITLYDETLPT